MDFALARQNMVEGQIRTNRVTDQYLVDALEQLPREDFVAGELKKLAYIDEDLTVAAGRILMEPMVMARLLQAAHIEDTDLCLVVGSATGYEAAVIAKLASAVVAIDSNKTLIKSATKNLADQGCDTVSVMAGDLVDGQADQGPYDVIFINGAVADLPTTLTDQLAEGGRLVYVQSQPRGTGKAMMVTKNVGVVSETELFDANVPALPEFAAKPEFNF
jgi:protein-L-isoaspartate(D-aspartate) O-methyltransferase